MEFGKIIKKESYAHNRRTKVETWYQVPILVKDKSSVISEVIKAVDLISDRKTKAINIRIEANDSFRFKMITKEYEVEG